MKKQRKPDGRKKAGIIILVEYLIAMRKLLPLLMILALFTRCRTMKPTAELPKTLGDPEEANYVGYQPLDPLPIFVTDGDSANFNKGIPVSNTRILNALPDETMRLAIGQIDASGNINFGLVKLGYEGNNYIVILDYIKYATDQIQLVTVKDDKTGKITDFSAIPRGPQTLPMKLDANASLTVVPYYEGVGLRMTATIKVNKGSVDLSNLFAIGAAAEAKQITGSLIIQTLGISGENISPLIPMPSQINTTTIQNAVLSLGAIKAKLYENNAQITPRIVGFYNNVGGGKEFVNKFISNFLSSNLFIYIKK
jgi:hypothetical protein